MWRLIRISTLLLVFFTVSAEAYIQKVKSTGWESTLKVIVFPVSAGNSQSAKRYIHSLDASDFKDVEDYLARQMARYRPGNSHPVKVVLAPLVEDMPPALGEQRNPLANMWYSLKLRYWVEHHDSVSRLGDVRLFVVFHDPDSDVDLPHSLGYQKGLMGVVHVYADESMAGANNFVLTHEFLHTVGATDKYDPDTNQPLYPMGYAMPAKKVLHPQPLAEIMGGRIPLDFKSARMPVSLSETIVGNQTAWEINWLN